MAEKQSKQIEDENSRFEGESSSGSETIRDGYHDTVVEKDKDSPNPETIRTNPGSNGTRRRPKAPTTQERLNQVDQKLDNVVNEFRKLCSHMMSTFEARLSRLENSTQASEPKESSTHVKTTENVFNTQGQESDDEDFKLSYSPPYKKISKPERVLIQAMDPVKPPEFNGDTDKAYDWLVNYKNVVKTNEWTNEMALKRLYHVFNETARCWLLNTFPDNIIYSWNEFESQFMKYYLNDDLEGHMRFKLTNLRQMDHEKLLNYYQRALSVCNLCSKEVPLQERIKYVIKGMAPDPRWIIGTTGPRNFYELEKRIRFYDENHASNPYRNRRDESNRTQNLRRPIEDDHNRRPMDQTWCLNCGTKGHHIRACPKELDQKAIDKRKQEWTQRKNISNQATAKAIALDTNEEEIPDEDRQVKFADESDLEIYDNDGKSFSIRLNSTGMNNKKKVSNITVNINGHLQDATVDTGATHTVIPYSIIKATKTDLYQWKSSTISLADGSTTKPLGWCIASIQYKGRTCTINSIVLMEATEILLGEDWLNKAQITISYGDKIIAHYDDYMHIVEKFIDRVKPTTSDGATQTDRKFIIDQPTINKLEQKEDELYIEYPMSVNSCKLDTNQVDTQEEIIIRSRRKVIIPPKTRARVEVKINRIKNDNEPTIINSKFDGSLYTIAGLTRNPGTIVEMINLSNEPQVIDRRQIINRVNSTDNQASQQEIPSLPDKLDDEINNIAIELLNKWKNIFTNDNKSLGIVPFIQHHIDTGDAQPIRSKPYRVSLSEQAIIKDLITQMEEEQIIRPSRSEWASPIVLVKKKGTTDLRFCVDYRKLNKITKVDPYPIPNMDCVLENLSGNKWFSKLDVKSMYWQVKMDEESKKKTSFVVHCGQYEFNVMPFGLISAPMTAMRVMSEVTRDMKNIFVFYDDILVFTPTIEEHFSTLDKLFAKLYDANIKLNANKCDILIEKVEYLGHLITAEGIQPGQDKIKSIEKFSSPKTITEARSFVNMCGFFRRFIKGFADIARPIYDTIKITEKFNWTEEAELAMIELKKRLISSPILVHFDPNGQLTVRCDASGFGLGAVLIQDHKEKAKSGVVAYTSRTLIGAEKNYATTHKECLALVHAVKVWRHYLYGSRFKIITDHHALCWLMKVKDHNGQLMRWALLSQEFPCEIHYESGKLHSDADCLSRNPLEANEQAQDEDKLPTWPIYALKLQDSNQVKDLVLPVYDIPAEQLNDPFCKNIIDHVDSDKTHKRSRFKNFMYANGQLYRRSKLDRRRFVLVLPRSMINFVLQEAHDKPTGGHFGSKRTKDIIKKRFYWKELDKDVDRYVKTCDLCQRKKANNQRKQGFMIPMRIPDKPFDIIGIDLTGPLPQTYRKNIFIIVITDYLTKYVIAKPIRVATSDKIIKILKEYLFFIHGFPKTIITDNGTNLTSQSMRKLINLLGINHKTTSPYRPQTNGQTERYNRVLGTQLAIFAGDKPKTWDQYLDAIVFAYNTTIHSSHRNSPYNLLHLMEPTRPLDKITSNIMIQNENKEQTTDQDLLLEAQKFAKQLIEQSQHNNKLKRDKNHVEATYQVNDLVLKHREIFQTGQTRKFTNPWLGPFLIIKRINDVNYQIQHVETKESSIVHIEQIKPYHNRGKQLQGGKATEQRSLVQPN